MMLGKCLLKSILSLALFTGTIFTVGSGNVFAAPNDNQILAPIKGNSIEAYKTSISSKTHSIKGSIYSVDVYEFDKENLPKPVSTQLFSDSIYGVSITIKAENGHSFPANFSGNTALYAGDVDVRGNAGYVNTLVGTSVNNSIFPNSRTILLCTTSAEASLFSYAQINWIFDLKNNLNASGTRHGSEKADEIALTLYNANLLSKMANEALEAENKLLGIETSIDNDSVETETIEDVNAAHTADINRHYMVIMLVLLIFVGIWNMINLCYDLSYYIYEELPERIDIVNEILLIDNLIKVNIFNKKTEFRRRHGPVYYKKPKIIRRRHYLCPAHLRG